PSMHECPLPIRLPDALMVSVSGVRGRVGAPLTPELMAGIAAAFGSYMTDARPGGTIMVGRDSRVSGPMYARAVIARLQADGCVAGDLGVVPTPTPLLAVEAAGGQGGLGIAAGHNAA